MHAAFCVWLVVESAERHEKGHARMAKMSTMHCDTKQINFTNDRRRQRVCMRDLCEALELCEELFADPSRADMIRAVLDMFTAATTRQFSIASQQCERREVEKSESYTSA